MKEINVGIAISCYRDSHLREFRQIQFVFVLPVVTIIA